MVDISCTKCGTTKPDDAFYRAKLGLHGRMSWCKICDRARAKKWHAANKDRGRENNRIWQQQNPEKTAARVRLFRRRHPERVAAIGKRYREQNKGKRAFWQMNRVARQKQAIPSWADMDAIKDIYANCPDGHHVDHIIPLYAVHGRKHVACGLHCEANLQYLPADENKRKWATLPEDAVAA